MDAASEDDRRDARRSQILAAAGRVFAGSPFDHASMDEIAHEAGLGKPTLYRYFPSKDALFAAVFEHALDDLEARLAAVPTRHAAAPERLLGLVAEIVPTFRRHLVSLRYLGDRGAVAGEANRRIFRERRARIGSYLARAIEDGIRDATMRPVESETIAQLLIGMLWSAAATMDSSDDEIGRGVADLALNGLVPRGAGAGAPRSGRAGRDGNNDNQDGRTAGLHGHQGALV